MRGSRIELSENEAPLREHAALDEEQADARSDATSDTRPGA
jgi:hypothetical protein